MLSFNNFRRLFSNFAGCGFSLETNTPDVLVLCETNFEVSIDSRNFSLRGYFNLEIRDSHAWFCS